LTEVHGSVRTVLGEVDPADLGVTYAHEHLVIDGGAPVRMNPDFQLGDVDRMAAEVAEAVALGLRTAVDAMPCDCGRNIVKLAELSRRSGIHIIAPTGLHHERYYDPDHWSTAIPIDELADRFTLDVTDGIDADDYAGPDLRRTEHRAGVIKIAGSAGGPSPRDLRVFEAAAATHLATGAPILTHCEGGSGALEQVWALASFGVPPSHIALSHVDKVVDRGYHRDLLATGAFAEYDGSFRWGDGENGTLQLLEWALEDDHIGGILLGMDAARQGYYHAFGGSPGLAWLLDGFAELMRARGLDDAVQHRLFVDNPARAFAFATAGGAS
jgi:predicted metal-dependent phosphotriesterase family hydrolase